MADITKMKRKDFEALPYRKWGEGSNLKAKNIIVMPHRKRHDSGYNTISFIAVLEDDKLIKFGGCTDAVSLHGGEIYNGEIPPSSPIEFDILPGSNLIRLWTRTGAYFYPSPDTSSIWIAVK